MAQFVNGRAVIHNARGYVRQNETLILAEAPRLTVVVRDASTTNINVSPDGAGFQIALEGFPPGADWTSFVTGNFEGRDFTMVTIAARKAELSQGPVYSVECFMVEG